MACVQSLLNSLIADCTGTAKIGGVAKAVWIATIDDIASVTYGTGYIVTAITFKTDKGFVKFSGKTDKNSGDSDIEAGENFNVRNQTVNLAIYTAIGAQGAADRLAVDQLIDQEQVLIILQTNAGDLLVYGLNLSNFSAYGLKVTANPGSTGVAKQDSTNYAMVLSGGLTNLELSYAPAVALATNIAALDALVVEP